jgi:hypothetical protein
LALMNVRETPKRKTMAQVRDMPFPDLREPTAFVTKVLVDT